MKISPYLIMALFATFVSMLLSSCVTTHRTNYLQSPGAGIPSYQPIDSLPDYRLLVGDELSIYVFSLEEEANKIFNSGLVGQPPSRNSEKNIYTYTVNEDGHIKYPIVGKVYVAGKTLREVSVLMKEQLRDRFIVNDFSVNVLLVSNSFSVITEKGSGKYPLSNSEMTIFQAIATSQDLAEYSDRSHVKIIRQTEDGPIISVFDIRSRDILNSEFYYVRPNDVIYVQSYDGQFFRLNSFATVLSSIMTAITFGIFVWTIGDRL